MKAKYMKPETKTYMITTESHLLGESIGEGQSYKSGDTVLSRESDWDDEY